MTTMITEVYNAFRKAGVPEQDAQAAAEALSSENLATKSDINEIKQNINKLDYKIKPVQWMIGLVIVVEVLPLLKNLFP